MRVDYSKSRSEKEAQGTCSHLDMGLVDRQYHTAMILALGPFALGKQNWHHLHLWGGKVKKNMNDIEPDIDAMAPFSLSVVIISNKEFVCDVIK